MNIKPTLVGAIVLLIILTAFHYSKYPVDSKEGIIFSNETWPEILKKAKEQKKPIFLDIYATWCGPCKRLKRNTFSDKEVGTYFNTNFINVALDGEKGDGLSLAQKYGINGYPSLLIIDQNENVIIYAAGYHSPSDLINFGKTANNKIK